MSLREWRARHYLRARLAANDMQIVALGKAGGRRSRPDEDELSEMDLLDRENEALEYALKKMDLVTHLQCYLMLAGVLFIGCYFN